MGDSPKKTYSDSRLSYESTITVSDIRNLRAHPSEDTSEQEDYEQGALAQLAALSVLTWNWHTVGCEDDRAFLVALGDDLEQGVGVVGGHGQVAELVDG